MSSLDYPWYTSIGNPWRYSSFPVVHYPTVNFSTSLTDAQLKQIAVADKQKSDALVQQATNAQKQIKDTVDRANSIQQQKQATLNNANAIENNAVEQKMRAQAALAIAKQKEEEAAEMERVAREYANNMEFVDKQIESVDKNNQGRFGEVALSPEDAKAKRKLLAEKEASRLEANRLFNEGQVKRRQADADKLAAKRLADDANAKESQAQSLKQQASAMDATLKQAAQAVQVLDQTKQASLSKAKALNDQSQLMQQQLDKRVAIKASEGVQINSNPDINDSQSMIEVNTGGMTGNEQFINGGCGDRATALSMPTFEEMSHAMHHEMDHQNNFTGSRRRSMPFML